ncbi:MAG: peptide deformylase [Kiritimatiellae bacterium]|nr:peptide deformylase [Kiritimatiellia bacterium]
MILKIFKYGDKILREKAKEVPRVTPELARLADDMLATMRSAKGVGLAAEQVGRLEKVCVIEIPPECENEADAFFNSAVRMPLKMFNPEIISQEGSEKDKEGCLSFPDIGGSVTRAAQVVCRYTDENNMPQAITARGYLARSIQHECDHLEGILYVDRMTAVERLGFAPKLKKLSKANGGAR